MVIYYSFNFFYLFKDASIKEVIKLFSFREQWIFVSTGRIKRWTISIQLFYDVGSRSLYILLFSLSVVNKKGNMEGCWRGKTLSLSMHTEKKGLKALLFLKDMFCLRAIMPISLLKKEAEIGRVVYRQTTSFR